jgi:hypothetical protein
VVGPDCANRATLDNNNPIASAKRWTVKPLGVDIFFSPEFSNRKQGDLSHPDLAAHVSWRHTSCGVSKGELLSKIVGIITEVSCFVQEIFGRCEKRTSFPK